MTMIGNLLGDSRVRAHSDQPGRYTGEISDAWQMFAAFGGMAFTIALRAASEAAGDGLRLVYASAAFSRPLKCGPLEIETEQLLRSTSTAQIFARLHPPGDPRPHVSVLASFGRGAEHPAQLQELSFPTQLLPPADAIPTDPGSLPGFPLLQQSETRWGHDFWNRPGRTAPPAFEREPAVVSSWIRYHVPPLRDDGTWDPITYAAPADSMSPALFRGLGPSVPMFYPITVAMDLHVFATTRRPWLLQHCKISRFVDGYACGVVELWDEDRTLLAVSTQRRWCKPLPPQGLPASE